MSMKFEADKYGVTITTDARKRTDSVFYTRIPIDKWRKFVAKVDAGKKATL